MLRRILSLAAIWGTLCIGCDLSQVRSGGIPTAQRVDALKESCEQGQAASCYRLGFIFQYGQGVPESRISAEAYYRQACKLGMKESCQNPYTAPQRPQLEAGLNNEDQQAVEACDQGRRGACEDLNDRGVRCLREDRDAKGAATLWLHACEKKFGTACFNLGLLLEPQDLKLAAKAFNAACDNGSGAGCLKLAKVLSQGRTPEAMNLAAQYFIKACEAGEAEGCATVAVFFQRACDTQNLADACAGYAVLLLQGKGISADFNKGKQYARKACRLGSQSGCKLEEMTP